VLLRAVVTYYDPLNDPKRPACFASDSSGGVYVDLRFLPAVGFQAGDLVEITGRSAPGGYAPIVVATQVHVLGKSRFPSTVPRVTLTEMLTGSEDGRWVEVEGVVHAVRESKRHVDLYLSLNDGEIMASTTRQMGEEYESLVDAKVRLRGNAAPLFNQQGQMAGFYLLFPDRARVTVEEPAPAHPFTSPVSPLSSLLRFTPSHSSHRIHIRGTVTLSWPGRMLCIQDGPHGLCAQTGQTTLLSPGELADVIGFPISGAFTPTLTHASYQPAGSRQPVPAPAVTAEEALRGNHDSELVELEGQLIGQDDFASDPNIVLSSGNHVFSAVLPRQWGVQRLSAWEKGTKLKIVGICSVKSADDAHTLGGDFSIPESFRILLRSPLDVMVLQSPSWWTPTHATATVGGAVFLTLVVLAWVFVLRKHVHEQTDTIREQLVEHQRSSAVLAEQAEELSRQAAELLRSRQALEAQTLTLKGVLDSMHEGLVAADEHGKFIIWNPAAEKILGLGATGLPPSEWSAHYGFYLPDGVTLISPGQTPLQRAIAGEVVATEMFVRNSALNHDVWLEVSSAPLRDEDGAARGGVIAFRDVTGRKADELEIRKLNEGLEERIATRTSQLEAANRDLEAFSYSVSHNLRAPLRHITSFSRIMMNEFGPLIPVEARTHLQRIEVAVHRMGLLIDALLALAKLGRRSLRLRHNALNSIVDDVISALQSDIEGRDLEWRIARLPSLDCDQILVGLVFENLLSNSLKFSRGCAPAIIEVDTIREPGKPTVIFVRDNGVGLDMRYAGKLFTPFQRMHTEPEFEGTGVGLAMVHRVIEKHGGTIWAEAEVNHGATFYFTLSPQ
jgi:PAS domain S-box-containing protein